MTNNPNNEGQANGHIGASHHDARDIVPPFIYEGEEVSQNWDAEGQAIHANGCVAPDEPTQVPPTDVPPTDVPSTEVPGTETPGTETPGTEAPGTQAPTTPEPGKVTDLPETGAGSGSSGMAPMILLASALAVSGILAGLATKLGRRQP